MGMGMTGMDMIGTGIHAKKKLKMRLTKKLSSPPSIPLTLMFLLPSPERGDAEAEHQGQSDTNQKPARSFSIVLRVALVHHQNTVGKRHKVA